MNKKGAIFLLLELVN